MDKRLHQLESFLATGDDGKPYQVRGYEHMARLDGTPDHIDAWEPVGVSEYKLANGEHVDMDGLGQMTVAHSGVRLVRESGS